MNVGGGGTKAFEEADAGMAEGEDEEEEEVEEEDEVDEADEVDKHLKMEICNK
jgi:hypothetical protein